jgi:hypothetical protein
MVLATQAGAGPVIPQHVLHLIEHTQGGWIFVTDMIDSPSSRSPELTWLDNKHGEILEFALEFLMPRARFGR